MITPCVDHFYHLVLFDMTNRHLAVIMQKTSQKAQFSRPSERINLVYSAPRQ